MSGTTTDALAVLGVVGASAFTLCVGRVLFAVWSKCDFDTATARKAPSSSTLVAKDRVWWITGASSGVGRTMALLLSKRYGTNVKLILSSRREQSLQEVATACKKLAPTMQVSVLPLDLMDVQALESKARRALQLFGRVDVLFNNGGVSSRTQAHNSSFEVDVALTNIDYLAPVAITKALLPHFNKGSLIINTNSVAGLIGVPARTGYCGAKHAARGYFNALRVEALLQNSEIEITNVVLGSTRTNIAHNALCRTPSESFDQADKNIEEGLDPDFVCDRILAAAHANIWEPWIAPSKEILITYLGIYFPRTAMKLLRKAAKQYDVEKQRQVPAEESAANETSKKKT